MKGKEAEDRKDSVLMLQTWHLLNFSISNIGLPQIRHSVNVYFKGKGNINSPIQGKSVIIQELQK